MSSFHKPKMYRSADGCCICRAKSSSSRFTAGQRYQTCFRSCFGLGEVRHGDICNACVLLIKRWKKLPAGSKKNWNHVVDAKAGSSVRAALRMRKMKKMCVQSELKRSNSDARSTTSSASPAQSPSYSNQSDEGSDTELPAGSAPSPVFSFLDLKYWRRQKVCCGVVYRGRYGEVLLHPHLYRPCCQRKPPLPPEDRGGGEEEEQAVIMSTPCIPTQEEEQKQEEQQEEQEQQEQQKEEEQQEEEEEQQEEQEEEEQQEEEQQEQQEEQEEEVQSSVMKDE